MRYDKLITTPEGEEFPYAESLNDGAYEYHISVIWDDRHGELYISSHGAHMEFDDGSWLDFNIFPKEIFPSAQSLSELDLLKVMDILATRIDSAAFYSKEQMEEAYERYHRDHSKESA